MSDKPKLCKDCKWHEAKREIDDDICLHEKALYGGGFDVHLLVRGPIVEKLHYPCHAMRAGICGFDARLFEP